MLHFIWEYLKKKHGGDKMYDYGFIILMSALFILMGFVLMALYRLAIARYGLMLLLFGFTWGARDKLREYFKQILNIRREI